MDEAHRIAPNFFPSACGKTRLVVIPMSNREDPACRLPTVAGRQGISIFLGFWQTAAPAQRQKWSPRALSQRAPGGAFIPPTPFRLSLACPAYPELLRREGICEGTREGCSLCRRVLGGGSRLQPRQYPPFDTPFLSRASSARNLSAPRQAPGDFLAADTT